MNKDNLRKKFEADAKELGFDLTRTEFNLNVEPWDDYIEDDTGHRYGGFIAGYQAAHAESAAKIESLQETIVSLEQKLVEAEKDVIRMDFLDSIDGALIHEGFGEYNYYFYDYDTRNNPEFNFYIEYKARVIVDQAIENKEVL